LKIIYKFPIDIVVDQIIKMPTGSKVLTVQTQKDTICLWAIVDLKSTTFEDRKFSVYGTGHPFDKDYNLEYIGTVQQIEGKLIWHVFEVKK